ncbi:MAG: pyridoxal phosphate-dependent aminotransferase [Clostridia bacterium]|nr:pyridoxal phosphate-dependent aminotransferase [Oscillospiraceae bacterium]MBQ7032831.1 pyridoxal phosphate-dependent aminotransferase [Clostridia bacterium]
MQLSKKYSAISPSPTLTIDAKFKAMKADGVDVVGFGAGEPDFDTPDHIKAAAIRAIENGETKYTPASGTLQLKKAICKKLQKENGLTYEPGQIVISNGAKHSLTNVFGAILNPGDEVIIPAPYWVSYPEMVKLNDGVPCVLETKEENGFKFTADELDAAITPKTRALVLNSPSNPTGMVYTREELSAIADIVVKRDIFVVSDEIYEHLIYEGERISIASFSDEIKKRTIIVNGLSKTFAMTGWRIGYTASEPEIAKLMSSVQSHATSNPNSIAQAASVAALEGGLDFVCEMKAEYKRRRDFMVSRINSIPGLSCKKPAGAFYVMMNMKELIGKKCDGEVIDSASKFADLFLDRALVAVVPGEGFMADGYVRWSYATNMENIKKGLDRLEAFVKTLI